MFFSAAAAAAAVMDLLVLSSNQINRCGPTLHAYVQLSRSGRCSSQEKTQVLN